MTYLLYNIIFVHLTLPHIKEPFVFSYDLYQSMSACGGVLCEPKVAFLHYKIKMLVALNIVRRDK